MVDKSGWLRVLAAQSDEMEGHVITLLGPSWKEDILKPLMDMAQRSGVLNRALHEEAVTVFTGALFVGIAEGDEPTHVQTVAKAAREFGVFDIWEMTKPGAQSVSGNLVSHFMRVGAKARAGATPDEIRSTVEEICSQGPTRDF